MDASCIKPIRDIERSFFLTVVGKLSIDYTQGSLPCHKKSLSSLGAFSFQCSSETLKMSFQPQFHSTDRS